MTSLRPEIQALLPEAERTINRVARSFSLAARLLPRDVRRDVQLLYLVLRTLDDLVDAEVRIGESTRAAAERRLAAIAAVGRVRAPREVTLVTYFLRYHRMHWVQLDRMGQHWQPARLAAEVDGDNAVTIKTLNVTGFTLDMPPGHAPFSLRGKIMVHIDGQDLETPPPATDRSWKVSFSRVAHNGKWVQVQAYEIGRAHV